MSNVWLRYRDDDGKSYYYNVSSQDTTYKFPVGDSVWDAKNKKKLRLPGQSSSKAGDNYSDEEYENDDVETEIPDYSALIAEKYAGVEIPVAKLEKLLNKVKLDKLEHSDKPIESPILLAVKKGDAKTAVRNYKIILKWIGYNPKGLKGTETIDEVFSSIGNNKDLIDETYFDLWKLSSKCKNSVIMKKVLKLFLAVATSFVPSPSFHIPILHFLSQLSSEIRLAKFILVRFQGTVLRNAPLMPCRNDKDISAIYHQYLKGTMCFGITITEMFFHMRHKRPHAPIPYMIYALMNKVTELGGRDKENIYRTSSSRPQDSIIAQANDGKDIVSNLSVDDATVYAKNWLETIPGKLVPSALAEKFRFLKPPIEPSAARAFVENLPQPNQAVLKYIIGYLRDYSSNSSVNHMDVKAFSDVFGPRLVYDDDKQDQIAFQAQQSSLITTLITDYDTSGYYPIDPSLMQ